MFKSKLLLPLDIQFFAEGDPPAPPTFAIGDFTQFLESNNDAQTLLQARISDAVKQDRVTYEQELRTAIAAEYDTSKKKTPEQIEIEELRAEIEKNKKAVALSQQQAVLASKVASLELDDETNAIAINFCLDTDEVVVTERFEALSQLVEKASEKKVEQAVAERLRGMSHNPKGNTRSGATPPTPPDTGFGLFSGKRGAAYERAKEKFGGGLL